MFALHPQVLVVQRLPLLVRSCITGVEGLRPLSMSFIMLFIIADKPRVRRVQHDWSSVSSVLLNVDRCE